MSDHQNADPLLRHTAYRLALEVVDHAWHDSNELAKRPNTRALSDQLYRSAGSIGANFSEGYSRSSGRDRVRMLEYALGSARECRVWYHGARHALDPAAVEAQELLLDQICRLLMTSIPRERDRVIRAAPAQITNS